MAARALNLIRAFHTIHSVISIMLVHEFEVVDESEMTGTDAENPDERPLFVCTPGFPKACEIAAKASHRRNWTYAAALYQLSQTIHANEVMDLDPVEYPMQHRSDFAFDHVRYAYAIVTSYAIVEQLGLDVRASSKRPSLIDGNWNPPVLANLQERLRRARVDPDSSTMWMIRGGKTRIEAKRPPRSLGKKAWAYRHVRDCNVKIVDAINDLSWLRSKVSAHRVDELVELLSVHDVANAQNLTRRLILNSLGYGREAL